jgi:hypothetical protein
MKKLSKFKYLFCAATLLLGSLAPSLAQPIVHRFNTASSTNNWTKWWGSDVTTIGFDSAMDAAANLSSGALKVTATFNFATYGGDNQFAIRGALSGNGNLSGLVVDATKYDRLEFDLYWDPSSPTRPSGDYGGLDVGLVPTDYSQVWFPNFGVTNVGQWTHISLAVSNLNQTQISQIGGVVLKMWSGDTNSEMTGTATFWVDNLKLIPKGFITDFDNESYISGNGFWNWWGGAARTVSWDPAKDAANDTNSGSINISVTFSGTGDNQYSEGMSLSGTGSYNSGIIIPTAGYSSLEFDLLWDTNSTLAAGTVNTNGDPQGLGLGLGSTSWGQTWIPTATEPQIVADGAWHHVSIPINPTWPDTAGLIFKKYFNTGAQFTGTMNFWVDNISFTPSSAPPPLPKMSLTSAKTGLNLFLSQPGQQYQREGIRSIPADSIQWYGNPNPVTYSVTIGQFPDGAAYGGVQCHIFLVPDTAGANGPDYADPNAIMLDIRASAANAGLATFRFKTNQPNGNSQMYNSSQGQLGPLNAPSVLGTWSLSFNNNTNIVITGPGGATTNLVMSPDAAAMFNSTTPVMGTYFGIQPNNAANIGQGVNISEIKVTSGSTVVVDDKFPTPDPTQQVDPNLWTLKMDDTAGIFVVDQLPAYWLGWSLPDSGYALQAKTNLNSAAFPVTQTPVLNGGARLLYLPPPQLPATKESYFFLKK